ncbi:MAG: succinate--CoA ligase subunit alpha [bacterium]
MSILIDATSRVVVQNMTGREGSFHTRQMLAYGTKVVAGTAPGKGGQSVEDVPVFDSLGQAVGAQPADTSIIFVPAPFAPDAIVEAADHGIRLIVCITEGIPALDMVKVYAHVRAKGCRLIGPNCPGLISPGRCKVGIMPANVYSPGPVGVVSRSGTLTYEIASELTALGLGQSTCVGIGGDPIIGSSFIDILNLFEEDPETRAVALIGEIGGADEEEAAAFIAGGMKKPVVALVAGKTAPSDKRMGHAGAIVSAGRGTAAEKIKALEEAGATVAGTTEEMAQAIAGIMAADCD